MLIQTTLFLLATLFVFSVVLVWRKNTSNQVERFLALLGQHTGSEDKRYWSFSGRGELRMFSTTRPHAEMNPQERFCPITWVCYRATGKEFFFGTRLSTLKAAAHLGLSTRVANRIMNAVDVPAGNLEEKDQRLRYRIQSILEIPSTISK